MSLWCENLINTGLQPGVGGHAVFGTVSTVSGLRGKPLKRLIIPSRCSTTRLKPGANESGSFIVRTTATFHTKPTGTSICTLKRRERRAPTCPFFGPTGRNPLAQPDGLGLRAAQSCGRKGRDRAHPDTAPEPRRSAAVSARPAAAGPMANRRFELPTHLGLAGRDTAATLPADGDCPAGKN